MVCKLPVSVCSRGTVGVVLGVALIVLSGLVRAEDFEDPILPTSVASGYTEFGDMLVETLDVLGGSIDAREAIEPWLTTELIRNELPAGPPGVVQVITQPTFSVVAPSPE